MTFKLLSLKAALAAGALVLSTAASLAAPAYATGSVNVRSGPGTWYSRVDTLRPGERVDVRSCQGSWCYVIKGGPDGWVASSYLARGGAMPRPPQYDEDYAPPPPPRYQPHPPTMYPGYGYPGYGWGYNYPRPYNPGVCFGGGNGYFCVNP